MGKHLGLNINVNEEEVGALTRLRQGFGEAGPRDKLI